MNRESVDQVFQFCIFTPKSSQMYLGQHVSKATHGVTGICQDLDIRLDVECHRSQKDNLELAKKIMRFAIAEVLKIQ